MRSLWGGRPTAPLFVQLLALIGISLAAAQAISLLLIFNLPPPIPDFYRLTEIAQALQGYLQKIGMEVNVQQLAQPAWLAANINGDMNLTPLQYIGADADALSNWFTAGQYFNWSHYSDPKLTELFQQGRAETDPSKRVEIYKQAQRIIMEQAVMLPIRLNIDLTLTAKKLTGVTYSGGGFQYLGAASMAD